ncbi:MAG: Holliday junction resolvase RuvX [Spirochaetia bacterium]
MGRILGIDLGTRRVGLALTDPLRTFGSPLATLTFVSEKALVAEITGLCAERGVDLVVIGMPYEADGSEGEGCARSRRIQERLEAAGLKTALHDETWSSRDAEAALRETGKTRRNSKEAVDMIAASLILRDYLEHSGHG